MLNNETATKKHETHRTFNERGGVGGKKRKDEQKQQTILKFILSPKVLLRLTQVYNY